MRLRTIWTLRGMSLRERLDRTKEWVCRTVGTHLPKNVRYWTTMGEIAGATADYNGEIPAMPLDVLLKRLRKE